MNSSELRQKFLEFFEKKGHKIVPSSSLLPKDPSVLFTSAGMQQFKDYYLENKSPYGSRVASCQKCFRTSDIEEVGDNRHLTFLEMMGNFSFGDYFKKETITWTYEFITKIVGLEIDYVSVFAGDKDYNPPITSSHPPAGGWAPVPEDKESQKIWLELGIPKAKIKKFGREDNFWGPTGLEGPCGPTSEIYVQGIEIWNLVFNEYFLSKDKILTPLKQKGIDTGMGLERLAAVSQKVPSVFETDLFEPLINEIKKNSSKPYTLEPEPYRIIADHIKSSVFLISEGIFPSNVEQGYVLRRILRRAIRYGKLLGLPKNFLFPLAKKVVEIYEDIYPEVRSKETDILTVIQKEEEKFAKTLVKGLKQFEKVAQKGDILGIDVFHLYDTYGFPLELTEELSKERGVSIDKKGFEEAFKKHQEISRAGVESKFGGGGEFSPKLHTATHLLHAALRQILGVNVKQMGSDITSQRLRFDFSYSQKMTPQEIKKVEDLVNKKIKEDLEVKKEEMSLDAALKSGALAFAFFSASVRQQTGYGGSAVAFGIGGKEKYPEKVTVYSIGNFSKEICAGPHIKRTSELGHFKIIKEESSGAGIRRIRAILG